MEPFVGEVGILPYTFPPVGWARCDGQAVSTAQNQVLYAVIGTTFGGDGRVSFQLPNLIGKTPMGTGNGPGLNPRAIADVTGEPVVSLTERHLPPHNHKARATVDDAEPSDAPLPMLYPGQMVNVGPPPNYTKTAIKAYATYVPGGALPMATAALAVAGQSEAHENRQPFLGLNFCIAMDGLFPSRS